MPNTAAAVKMMLLCFVCNGKDNLIQIYDIHSDYLMNFKEINNWNVDVSLSLVITFLSL
jgi:hypothetical protein